MNAIQNALAGEGVGFSREDLAEIAARARNLYERRAATVAYDGGDPAMIEARLAAWERSAAKGRADEFARRLKLEGLDADTARALLGTARSCGDDALPEWARTLDCAVRHALNHPRQEALAERLDIASAERFPFHELLLPLVDFAARKLAERIGETGDLLAEAALAPSERTLLHLLCAHCSRALHLEFTAFKATRRSGLGRLLQQSRDGGSRTLYDAFIDRFRHGRYTRFFSEYAVLARQVANAIDYFVDALAEFVARLRNDRDALAETFNDGRALGAALKLTYGGSDRHNRARATVAVRFESGPRLVYKPKPLDTDVAIAELVGWINARAELLPLATPPVLPRDGYGWQAWIEHTPCADEEAVRRFYLRSGYLLCLVYALEGYDCHYENLVAGGEFPYLIDTETIFNPYKELDAISSSEANALVIAGKEVFYSVIRTGMLPGWSMPAPGQRKDTSGFGGGSLAGNERISRLRWVEAASDEMRLEPVTEEVPTLANLPFVEAGRPRPADAHVDLIIEGFRQMYGLLTRHREAVQEIVGRWRDLHVRYVRHATRIYSDLLWDLARPEHLRDGADWHIAFDLLARNFLAAERNFVQRPEVWALLRSEARALMDLDVPYFKVRTGALDIEDGFGEVIVRDYFREECHVRLEKKLAGLNARDETLQVRYIQYAFYARAAHSFHAQHAACDTDRPTPTATLAPLSAAECVAVAREIGDELIAQAVRAPDGSIAWIALEYIKEMDAFQFKPISYNLYSGTAGIALFLAALYRATGDARYRDACRSACNPVLQVMETELDDLVRFTGIGGGVGAGSLIYGLAAIADLINDAELLAAAHRCAETIGPEQIARDDKYDLIFGTAGCALGLLKLHAITKDATVLTRAVQCGEHLLSARRAGENGLALVPTYAGHVVTGLSHGAAGIALAFMRLFEACGDRRFHDAAMDHVAFEEALFDPALDNYPDYRSRPGQPAVMTTWCHGAPGIGLSRMALYRIHPHDELREQITRDLAVADRFSLEHLDHICCGNLGRIDILADYARLLDDAALRTRVLQKARWTVERYRREGGFALFMNAPTKVFSPGLFVGSSGIAYALLRLADPGLPSVLAYE